MKSAEEASPKARPAEKRKPADKRKPKPVNAELLDNRQLLGALRSLQRGEFGIRLPDDFPGVEGQICTTFNEIAQFAGVLKGDVAELRQSVGREGRTHRRLAGAGARGGWGDYVGGVNELAMDDTAGSGKMWIEEMSLNYASMRRA